MRILPQHIQNALQHTKKNKNNFLLTNTQKKIFKAKGLIFYLLLNTQNIKVKFFQFFNKKVI